MIVVTLTFVNNIVAIVIVMTTTQVCSTQAPLVDRMSRTVVQSAQNSQNSKFKTIIYQQCLKRSLPLKKEPV